MTSSDRTAASSSAHQHQQVGQPAAGDTAYTEGELMDRAVDDARTIDAPPKADGSLADPVTGAGSGFTRNESSRENPLSDTTVSQAAENLDVPGDRGDD